MTDQFDSEPEICSTDAELSGNYHRFILRAIQTANQLGLTGKKIVELQWHEDMLTGRKHLRFKYEPI